MTTYRDDTLEGTVGATPSAGAIGLDTLTGAGEIIYVEPGWQELTSAVQYTAPMTGTLTDTFAATVTAPITFKAPNPPVGGACEILAFDSAGNVPFSVWANEDGTLELQGPSGDPVDTTDVSFCDDDWHRIYPMCNGDGKVGRLVITDRLLNILDTLEIACGGQDKITYREGAMTDVDFAIIFSRSKIASGVDYPPVDKPNIVYVVVDDAPAQVMKHMSVYRDLQAAGVTFINHFAATPLCAPSRACMYSGKYPMNNGVLGNGQAVDAFRADPTNEPNAIGARMARAGYHTGHFGKYLHGFETGGQTGDNPTDPLWVPQGWDWALLTSEGYQEFDVKATVSKEGVKTLYDTTGGGAPEEDYFTDIINEHLIEFLQDHVDNRPGQPFYAHVSPFAPHNNVGGSDPEDPGGPSFPAAPRDRPIYDDSSGRPGSWDPPEFPVTGDLGDLTQHWPDPVGQGNWHIFPEPKMGWMPVDGLDGDQDDFYHANYLDTVRQMQSVNDLLRDLRGFLDDNGLAGSTYIIVTSDNGYHRGEHNIPTGKGTPYDDDSRLPFIVYPPGGLDAPVECDALIQFPDLLPTVLDIAGRDRSEFADVDGFSWLPYLRGELPPEGERRTSLMMYTSGAGGGEGGFGWQEALGTGDPPNWIALRSKVAIYVTWDPDNPGQVPDIDRGEAYETDVDPWMLINLWGAGLVPSFRAWPIAGLLSAYITAKGEDSRIVGQQEFILTGGSAGRGVPSYVVILDDGDGGQALVDMDHPVGRWRTLEDGTQHPAAGGKTVSDFPTEYGLIVPVGFDDDVQLGPGSMTLHQLITSLDDQGSDGGYLSLDQNRKALLFPFVTTRGTIPMGQRPAAGLPVEWVFDARVLNMVAPEIDVDTAEVSIPLQIPAGMLTARQVFTWSFPFHGPTADTPAHVTTLAGSSAPVLGAIWRVRGTLDTIVASDPVTGLGFTWDGDAVDRVVADDEWLILDTGRSFRAVIVDNDTWDFDDASAVDVSAGIDPNHTVAWLLPLQPAAYNGDPDDLRIYVVVGGANRAASTLLEIRAARTKALS